MTPPELHDFFVASASVAGALIGLLFVAISVAHERLTAEDAEQSHRVRAAAALTSFMNALSISLFALIPGVKLGWTAFVVGLLGLLFVAASLISLLRARRFQPGAPRDALFLIGLVVTTALEVLFGRDLIAHPHNADAAETIAVLVIVSFVIGVARSWELIGGPSIGIGSELTSLVQERRNQRRGEGADARE